MVNKSIYSLSYYATFFVCLINALRVYSLWGFYGKIGHYLDLLSIGMTILLLPLVFSLYKGRGIFLLSISLLFTIIVGVNSDRLYFLWTSFVLIVGAKGKSFKAIVKFHFIVCLCFCLFNVYGYEIGALKQANNYIDGIREGITGDWTQRLDFGYGWATDFANHVFYILLDFWILVKGKLKWWGYLLFLYMPFFVVVYTDSRLASGCILLLLISSLCLWWKEKKDNQIGRKMKLCMILSVPFFAVLSIWATFSYDPSNLYWFASDILLSGRLGLGYDAISEFGISWLGQPVEMHGAIDAGGLMEYNFVDSSYVHFLIRYGIVFISFLVLLFMRMSADAAKRNDNVLLIAIMIAGITGIVAQFVFDYKYCVLLLALVAVHEHNTSLSKVDLK